MDRFDCVLSSLNVVLFFLVILLLPLTWAEAEPMMHLYRNEGMVLCQVEPFLIKKYLHFFSENSDKTMQMLGKNGIFKYN